MIAELEPSTAEDLEQKVQPLVVRAQGLVIVAPEDYADAGGFLKDIKAMTLEIEGCFGPLKKKAAETHKAIVAEEKARLAPLVEAERLTKAAMLGYQHEQDRKAEAERRRLQAIADEAARKEREKAEQAAAKQRAIEAEARAKAEQARREAEQASAAERKKLLEEAAKAERQAAAAQAKANVSDEAAASVAPAPIVSVASAAEKVSGIAVRKVWKAEITDLSLFLAYVFDSRRADLVLPNLKILDSQAKGLKENASMPGVRFYSESQMAASGR